MWIYDMQNVISLRGSSTQRWIKYKHGLLGEIYRHMNAHGEALQFNSNQPRDWFSNLGPFIVSPIWILFNIKLSRKSYLYYNDRY